MVVEFKVRFAEEFPHRKVVGLPSPWVRTHAVPPPMDARLFAVEEGELAHFGLGMEKALLGRRRQGFRVVVPDDIQPAAAILHQRAQILEALELVVSQMAAVGGYRALTKSTVSKEMGRFVRFLSARDVTYLNDVTQAHVEEFLELAGRRGSAWSEPALATVHARRSAVRLMFRIARDLRLASHDPTLDLELPPRSGLVARPLTDEEEEFCRDWSRRRLFETAAPATWALGQTGATTTEIAHIRVRDIDLITGEVWVHGTPKRIERLAPLTDWGAKWLARRLREFGSEDADRLVVTDAGARSATSAVSNIMRGVLDHAGLSSETDIKPRSLAAWFGRGVYDRTGSIEETARSLGIRSFDQTRNIIGATWSVGEQL